MDKTQPQQGGGFQSKGGSKAPQPINNAFGWSTIGKGKGKTPDGQRICFTYNNPSQFCHGKCGMQHVCLKCFGRHPTYDHERFNGKGKTKGKGYKNGKASKQRRGDTQAGLEEEEEENRCQSRRGSKDNRKRRRRDDSSEEGSDDSRDLDYRSDGFHRPRQEFRGGFSKRR